MGAAPPSTILRPTDYLRGPVSLDVVLPIRAPAPWLKDTLEGLKKQSIQDWSLICVIHTGSLFLADQILEVFPRALVLEVPDTFILPQSLNVGLASSSANYVARIDADDVPLPARFAQQVSLLDAKPNVALVTSPVQLIDRDGRTLGTASAYSPRSLPRRLLVKNVVAHPAVMLRRHSVIGVGGYSVTAVHGEDYELWLRLAANGYELVSLEEPLTQYRLHSGQITATRAMTASGRKLIRSGRRDLARILGVSPATVAYLNLLWSVRQRARAVVRLEQ